MLKQDLGMSFVKAQKQHPQANSIKVKILRQRYALMMLPLLEQGKRVINVDETWLNETSFVRKVWGSKDKMSNTSINTVTPRLSMIAALDTHGNVWYSLSHATTDSDGIILFFKHLIQQLDRD